MYNHLIDTFLCVAEQGSFSKAAESLLMSPANVFKQINMLEEILKVPLIKRSYKGVELTEPGQFFYKESHRLIEMSETILSQTRHLHNRNKTVIRIGTIPLDPIDSFNRIWQNSPRADDFIIRFVNYPTDINRMDLFVLGDKYTTDISFSPEPLLESREETEVFPFTSNKLTCSVPASSPLSKKDKLSLSDLDGQTLLFPSRGNSSLTRQFSRWIRQQKTDVCLETPSIFYDIELFNRCAEEKKILISIDNWVNIHPGLVNIEVDWDWTIPCGIIWKKDAREDVLEFIKAFKEATPSAPSGHLPQ